MVIFLQNGRFFRVIYGRLETAPMWISETDMRFFRRHILAFANDFIAVYANFHKFLQNGRFFRVIYGRLETAPIWVSETDMRFLRAIYWRLETTLYQCLQTFI